jgi:methionyl-tRNA synthetase
VWFDALLSYITGIGYGTDEAEFNKWWPCDIHFIGKDITRFHCALWPAMLMAAGVPTPKKVFGHGFVYKKTEEGVLERFSKSLGNIVEPMEIVTKFSAEAFRYYFLRECPYPGDGEFSWARFAEVFNADLANNLGNLYSRVVTLITKNYEGVLTGTAGRAPRAVTGPGGLHPPLAIIREHVEACRYNQALDLIWRQILDPANQYAEANAPWKLVKTDLATAKEILFDLLEPLRVACILLKPFLPRSAENIYSSFNFAKAWAEVSYADAAVSIPIADDVRVLAQLDDGKVKPLFPRIS